MFNGYLKNSANDFYVSNPFTPLKFLSKKWIEF